MKILLGNAPWRKGDRLGVRAGSRWPLTQKVKKGEKIPGYLPFPFFLAYATALLEKNDYEASLVDAIAEGLGDPEFIGRIKDFKPDLVLLETSTPSIYADTRMAKKIKDELDVPIILCGPHVTAMPEEIMKNKFVDFILMGEYEYTLLDLVRHLEKNQDLKEVDGLVFRDKNKIKITKRRAPVDINELPWPARHLLPIYNYKDTFAGLPSPSVQMVASRGCPFKCIFCVWPEVMYGGHKYRVRDPRDVVDEMEWLIKKYRFKSIYFDDDTFDIGKDRIMELCREIKSRGIDVPWAVMARADTVDREMLQAMRDAGLYAIKYGVESGVQELVNTSRKNLDLSKVEETVKITKELGIKTHLTFTFGLPEETDETIRKTIDFALKLKPDSAQFSICTPFPGTEYYELANKKGWLSTKDWSKYDGTCNVVIRTENLEEEDLKNALKLADELCSKKFFMTRFKGDKMGYILKGIKNPIKGLKIIKRLLD